MESYSSKYLKQYSGIKTWYPLCQKQQLQPTIPFKTQQDLFNLKRKKQPHVRPIQLIYNNHF
jgi:hypothetical protein